MLAAAICAAMVTLLMQTELATMSARCTIEAMIGAIIVAFALTAGIAAADAVSLVRPGPKSITEAMPSDARKRLAMGRVATLAASGCGGLLLASAIGLLIAFANGSPPSWQALIMLPLASLVVASASGLGWALGIRIPSWFVPPAIVVSTYVVVAGDIGSARLPFSLFGGNPPGAAFLLPAPEVYAVTAAFWATLTTLAIALLFWWASRGGRLVVVATGLAAAAEALSLGGVGAVVETARTNDTLSVPENQSTWPCVTAQPGDVEICVPPDRVQDTAQLTAQLPALTQRLIRLDPTLRGRVWRSVETQPGTALVYALPLGQPTTRFAHAGEALDGLFRPCLLSVAEGPEEEAFSELMDASEALASWLGSDDDSPAALEKARSSYRRLSTCK